MNLFLDDIKDIRKFKSNKGKKFLVTCPKSRAQEILDFLTQITESIIVVEVNDNELINSLNKFIVINLDSNTPLERAQECITNSTDYNKEGKLDGESVSFMIDSGTKSQPFMVSNLLIQYLPKTFMLTGSMLGKNKIYYPQYSSQIKPTFFTSEKKPIAIIADWFANGDSTMMFRQLQAFIDNESKKGNEVHIITKPNYGKILEFFLKNCKIISSLENLKAIESLLRSKYYSKVYRLPILNTEPPLMHIYELCSKALGFEEIFEFVPLKTEILPELPQKTIQTIEKERTKGNKIVGLQFNTSSEERSWTLDQAEKFVSYCNENNISVMNLTPHNFIIKDLIDVSYLQGPQLFTFISHMDAVVGIDSFCGQIAGVLGVPNITVWGKNFPDLQDNLKGGKFFTSFRSISNNYSLVSRDTKAGSIPAEIVFKRLKQIFNSELILKKERITAQDTIDGIGIEWVGEG
ncbi:hypothetical protein ACTHO0_19180 [Cytobacillus praedii]|uniref:hypothetical protein n=1 Tax=Cytobacillus praedii TaxID=1742358 RepID=UPI003F800169